MTNEQSRIYKVADEADLQTLNQRGAVKLYQDCFADPPYEERFSDQEVESFLNLYFLSGVLMIAEIDSKVIGFAAAIPLTLEREIASLAEQFKIEPAESWYFADVGVQKTERRKRLGSLLVKRLLGQISVPTVLMRTSDQNLASQELNKQLGFTTVVGMEQFVEQPRQNGQVVKDRRIFLKYEKNVT